MVVGHFHDLDGCALDLGRSRLSSIQEADFQYANRSDLRGNVTVVCIGGRIVRNRIGC
jgi:hypothetical protein